MYAVCLDALCVQISPGGGKRTKMAILQDCLLVCSKV